MHFVKTGIYQQEFTVNGAKDFEVDTRKKEEVEQAEKLKHLPEFQRDRNFLSISEQTPEGVRENEDLKKEEISASSYAPPPVTEDEYEFLQAVENKFKKSKQLQRKEDEAALSEFRTAQNKPAQRGVQSVFPISKTSQKSPSFAGSKLGAVIVKKRRVAGTPPNAGESNTPPSAGKTPQGVTPVTTVKRVESCEDGSDEHSETPPDHSDTDQYIDVGKLVKDTLRAYSGGLVSLLGYSSSEGSEDDDAPS